MTHPHSYPVKITIKLELKVIGKRIYAVATSMKDEAFYSRNTLFYVINNKHLIGPS